MWEIRFSRNIRSFYLKSTSSVSSVFRVTLCEDDIKAMNRGELWSFVLDRSVSQMLEARSTGGLH
jgi:hypothetical protein